MNSIQKAAFAAEIAQAEALVAAGALAAALGHLERAHVIGQEYVLPHVQSHWLMLKLEVRRHRPLAAAGQAIRIILGGFGSAIGVVPTGNTGGSDVNMFKRMPIAQELQQVIEGKEPPERH